MRVKLNNTWHDVAPGQPLAVELTDADRCNIAQMLPEASRYAVFSADEPMTRDEMRAWIAE